MKKTIFILTFAALLCFGCQTGNQAQQPDYGRYLDRAQLALNVSLSIAEAYGADPVAIRTASDFPCSECHLTATGIRTRWLPEDSRENWEIVLVDETRYTKDDSVSFDAREVNA